MATDEQGIITMLQQKISEHEEKISSFRQAINALTGSTQTTGAAPIKAQGKKRGRKPGGKNKPKAEAPKVKATPVAPAKKRGRKSGGKNAAKPVATKVATPSKPTKPASSNGKETLESWVLKQFNDNVAKTNRTLMEIYNKETGKNLDMNGFAARLAILKRKGNVVSAKNEADGLSYNGRADMFVNGKLK